MKQENSKDKLSKPMLFHKLNIRLEDFPIMVRLSFIIVLVFLAILLLSYTNFATVTKEKKLTTLNMVMQTNHQTISKINDYIEDLSDITKFPLTHKYNDKSYVRELETFELTGESSLIFQKLNEQMFNDILGYKDDLTSVFIFNSKGDADYKSEIPMYKAFNPISEYWFSKSIDKFGKPYTIRTYELPNVVPTNGPHFVFGVARGIVRLETSQVVGVLLVNTEIDYLRNICNNMKISESERIIILDDKYTIYDTEEENIANNAETQISSINYPKENEMITININGEELFVTSIISEYTGWRVVSLIPIDELFHDLNVMQRSTIILSSIILLFTILFITLISKQIITPIKKLKLLMNLVETGNFDIKINIDSKDEIGSLAHSFNSMTEKINNLIQEVYIEQIEKGEIELQMLQSQINPHFLYNTLESISMMATINDDDTTSEMAANLGTILRYGISKNNDEVTVIEEVKILEKYIKLQSIRFHDSYNIIMDINPNIYNIIIIKLILQPIVENAIYHGMIAKRSNGIITVRGFQSDGILHFEVIDNGTGMNEDQTASLNGYINDQNNNFSSIGLRNVNKRIKIRYGTNYGIHIQSTLEEGTTVYVSLPVL